MTKWREKQTIAFNIIPISVLMKTLLLIHHVFQYSFELVSIEYKQFFTEQMNKLLCMLYL